LRPVKFAQNYKNKKDKIIPNAIIPNG
jgi:hypothetical protein